MCECIKSGSVLFAKPIGKLSSKQSNGIESKNRYLSSNSRMW